MDDILWKYSWINLNMLMMSIPKYDKDKEDKKDKDSRKIKDDNEFKGLMK